MNESKEIVHEFYHDISKNCENCLGDVKEVLFTVYKKIDVVKDEVQVINRLINYLYFKVFTEHFKFTAYQNELIFKLAQIGKRLV